MFVLNYQMELARFAFGEDVFNSKCRLSIDKNAPALAISYDKPSRTRSGAIRSSEKAEFVTPLLYEDVPKIWFYQYPEEYHVDDPKPGQDYPPFGFVTLLVKGENDLPGAVSLQFNSKDEMEDMLSHMVEVSTVFQCVEPAELKTRKKVARFAKPLLEDYNRAEEANHPKPARNEFTFGKSSDTILLVYPFAGDRHEIEAAASGLTEASGKLGRDQSESGDGDSENADLSDTPSNSTDSTNNAVEITKKVRQRGHYVTIRVEDYERLEPAEWLNDSLVDFWMQW